MTTIDTALTARPAAATPATTPRAELGQADFLTLMTAQLQNQDPFAPMENGEFLAQMAQFSTVSGLDRVNATLAGIGEGMRDFRIAAASSLLGKSVLVPGNLARPDDGGAIRGSADLPGGAEAVVVTYSDAASGTLLHSQTFGAQPPGAMAFDWDGLPPEMAAARSAVRIDVTLTAADGSHAVQPSVYARVQAARSAAGGADVTLQIEDYGYLNALEVESFR